MNKDGLDECFIFKAAQIVDLYFKTKSEMLWIDLKLKTKSLTYKNIKFKENVQACFDKCEELILVLREVTFNIDENRKEYEMEK